MTVVDQDAAAAHAGGSPPLSIDATHTRMHELIMRYGTDAEKQESLALRELMEQTGDIVPGSSWLPACEIVLPSIFDVQCGKVAAERQRRVTRFALDNKHGVTRTMAEEIRVAKGQYAACIMLGLPFNKYVDHKIAKARGNLGFGISAFVPKVGSYSLLVGEDVPASRVMVLILDEGDNRFEFRGWIKAGMAQIPQYQREFVRDGVTSRPYVVPPEYLSAAETWEPPDAT